MANRSRRQRLRGRASRVDPRRRPRRRQQLRRRRRRTCARRPAARLRPLHLRRRLDPRLGVRVDLGLGPEVAADLPPLRLELRIATDEAGEIYILTKSDGLIRRIMSIR